MVDEASKTTTTTQEPVVEQVPVTEVPPPDNITPTDVAVEKEPQTEPENPVPESQLSKPTADSDDNIPESGSFKEESNIVSDLPDNEKKALQQLKLLIQDALTNHDFSTPLNQPPSPLKQQNPTETVSAEKDKQEETKQEQPEDKSPDAATDEAPPAEPVDPATTQELQVEKASGEAEKETATGEVEETMVAAAETPEDKVAAPSVDDDGAKTVEAIEETVVAVVSSVPAEQPTEAKETEAAAPPPAEEETKKETKEEALPSRPPEQVSIWGIPLLADERSDVILLKFLRARDFKVKDAFFMIKNTIRWRKEFGIDELMEENLGNDLDKVVYMHGFDKEGHPVCYNIYGKFQNKELYKQTFSDEEKRQKFLRWRIQFLEKSIRKLDFSPGGICTIVQVNDLKNSPGPGKWELRQATKQALQLLQDNYPEFVAKQVPG